MLKAGKNLYRVLAAGFAALAVSTAAVTACVFQARPLKIGDALDMLASYGRPAAEAGFDISQMKDASHASLPFAGQLFGKPATGTVYAVRRNAGDTVMVRGVAIQSERIGFRECTGLMAGRYGPPVGRGIIPYLKGNGGAVYWVHFSTPFGTVRLQKASERRPVSILLYSEYDT